MKQYRIRLPKYRFVPFLISHFMLLLPSFACAGEFSLTPSISVSEEYTDNVFETRDFKRSDFITRLIPGLAFRYNSAFWDWDVGYAFDYRFFAKNTRDDDYTHNVNARGLTRLISDALFLEVTDVYQRVSLNVARDYTEESLYGNQSDSNNFTASPYFNFRLGSNSTLRTGYRYINVWYKDPTGIDRRQHVGFAEATYEYSPRLSLSASYTYTHENSESSYDRHVPYVGFRYEYKDRSFLFAQAGYTWFNARGNNSSNYPYWNAGLTHAFGTYTVSLATGVQYPEDPLSGVTRETDYTLTITKELSRGNVALNIGYANFSGDAIDTENRYGGGITARYDLGSRLQATLAAYIERYDHRLSDTYTRRIFLNPSLSYPLPKDVVITLSYVFADYYSPLIYSDNYTVNRVILEMTKTF